MKTVVQDPVDPRQRHHARVLGLLVGGGFLALMVSCIIIFSIKGLPKDPKEWKRLQEQRSAAEADKAQSPASVTTPEKDQPR